MIRIVNEDDVYVFDEFGWGETKFHEPDIAKQLLTNNFEEICQIEFFSIEKAIAIRINTGKMDIDYWFHDIDADLLNFMCQTTKLHRAIKRFFIRAGFSAFSVEQYPLLSAVLLGNNNEC